MKRRLLFLLFAVAVILTTGCGTTALNLKPDSQVDLTKYKSLAIQTSAVDGVVIPDMAQGRIKDRIKAEINSGCCPQRFETIRTDTVHPEDLVLALKFTQYDEGNRFARAMLAGLGAMKIDADVEVKDGNLGSSLCKGEAGKSFAWGGMYGAMTGIEDIEKDFAKEVSRGFGEMLGIPRQAASK
jgi:hypothetical protein